MADKLTDVELIEELQRFGEVVKKPIDRKKRPLLVKKLNHYRAKENIANKSKKVQNSRRKQIVEFSSEDESEVEDKPAPSTPGRLFGRKSVRNNKTPAYSNTETIEISPTSGRSTLRSRNKVDSPSTNKLYPDLSAETQQSYSPSVKSRGYKYQRAVDTGATYDYDGEFTDSDPDESIYEVTNKSMNTTFTIGESDNSNSYENEDDDEIGLNNTRSYGSRLPRAENSYSSTLYTKARPFNSNNVPINNFTEEEIRQQGFKTNEDQRKYKQPAASYVSTGILVVVAVFFVILAMTYLYIRRDILYSMVKITGFAGSDDELHHIFKRCSEGEEIPACFTSTEIGQSLQLVHTLEDFMKRNGGKNQGGTKFTKEKLKDNSGGAEEKIFNGTVDLIFSNPQWNIRSYNQAGDIAQSLEDVAKMGVEPALPFLTRVHRSLYRILVGLILLLTCTVFVLAGVMIWRHRVRSAEEEKKRVFDIVEKIIEIVKDNYENHQESNQQSAFMAVQHVRDQLLPPSKRRMLMPLWNKAVGFIEANESRIRVETQTIQGEDFMVWRWLPTSSNGGKVWQGQAFGENNVSSGNTLHYGPTPCLKIRNMFDTDMETEEEWEINIQDAILEKCRGIVGILHIHVDRGSREGCVYVKCNSCDTAFQVYRSLHGWWFDGRLVTVKYLRLEQYHEKFPPSKRATKPLKPSNNRMRSLSQPFHRSTLEMT